MRLRSRQAVSVLEFLDARSLARLQIVHLLSKRVEAADEAGTPREAAAAWETSSMLSFPTSCSDVGQGLSAHPPLPGWFERGTLLALALPVAKARVVRALGLTPQGSAEWTPRDAGPLDPYPAVVLSSLPLCRGAIGSWCEALDEVESWSALRRAVSLSPGRTASLTSDAAIFNAMQSLQGLERTAASHTFPFRSL